MPDATPPQDFWADEAEAPAAEAAARRSAGPTGEELADLARRFGSVDAAWHEYRAAHGGTKVGKLTSRIPEPVWIALGVFVAFFGLQNAAYMMFPPHRAFQDGGYFDPVWILTILALSIGGLALVAYGFRAQVRRALFVKAFRRARTAVADRDGSSEG